MRRLNGGWTGWADGRFPTDQTEPPAARVRFDATARTERLMMSPTAGDLKKLFADAGTDLTRTTATHGRSGGGRR